MTPHRHSRHRLRRRRGFTLLELLLTFTLIAAITVISVPSIRSVVKRHDGLDTVTHIAQKLSMARDQAIRRNRAYQVIISEMSANVATGMITISEAVANSCQSIIDRPGDLSALEVAVYGRSTFGQQPASNQPLVGITGWRIGRDKNLEGGRLELCFNARGALFIREGSLYSELGLAQIAVQQFQGPPLRAFGSLHYVNLSFSTGAQVQR